MTASPLVVVVIPTYNERSNLPRLVKSVARHGYRMLIVDDASPDGTGEVAEAAASDFETVDVVHRTTREGLGPAYTAGFDQALSLCADIVCGMDADFSHDPQILPDLVAPVAAGRADMVIGSRYVPGGSTPDWALHRRLLSRGGNIYGRRLLGLRVRDATSGYRVYRADALRALEFASCTAVGYLYLTEMTWRATRLGLRVAELPITFRDRQFGQSKMGGAIVLEAMWWVTIWGIERLLGLSWTPARGA